MILTYVITGAHGTGKSTLLNELRSIPGYSFSESVTRKSGANINQEGDEDGQILILNTIIEYEKANGLYTKDYILDRSFIDFYAYTIYLHRRQKVTDETLTRIKEEFDIRKQYYNMIFYLPIEFDIEQDGVRSTDIEFQKEIDSIISAILVDNELSFRPIIGTVEQRANEIRSFIPHIGQVYNKNAIFDTIGHKDGIDEFIDDDSYVMYHNNTIASLLSYKKTDRLKISYLYTDPLYRGCKLASKLMDKLLADHKGMIVYLYIKDDAMPFYKSYGLDKFIIGESIYSGSMLNYYATFYNGDTLEPVDIDEAIQSRLKS